MSSVLLPLVTALALANPVQFGVGTTRTFYYDPQTQMWRPDGQQTTHSSGTGGTSGAGGAATEEEGDSLLTALVVALTSMIATATLTVLLARFAVTARRNGVGRTLRRMLFEGFGGGWGGAGREQGAGGDAAGRRPVARTRSERIEHVAKLMQVGRGVAAARSQPWCSLWRQERRCFISTVAAPVAAPAVSIFGQPLKLAVRLTESPGSDLQHHAGAAARGVPQPRGAGAHACGGAQAHAGGEALCSCTRAPSRTCAAQPRAQELPRHACCCCRRGPVVSPVPSTPGLRAAQKRGGASGDCLEKRELVEALLASGNSSASTCSVCCEDYEPGGCRGLLLCSCCTCASGRVRLLAGTPVSCPLAWPWPEGIGWALVRLPFLIDSLLGCLWPLLCRRRAACAALRPPLPSGVHRQVAALVHRLLAASRMPHVQCGAGKGLARGRRGGWQWELQSVTARWAALPALPGNSC